MNLNLKMEEKLNLQDYKTDRNLEELISDNSRENQMNEKESNSKINQILSQDISKKFITKYKNEELNKFKDELLSFFKERENYLVSKINSYQSHIDSSERKYEHLTKIIKLNYQEILSSQANLNNRLDKFNSYEQFVSKTNDNMTSHEIRINNLRDDFSKATQKYDKIYLYNLELPGFIGRCAKYKNCQLFFTDVIKELNKLNNYKEKNTVDLKTYKDKLEQMIKTFKTMVDNNNEAQIKYINKMNEKNKNDCKNMVDVLGERVVELRLENSKYSLELINKTNELKEQMTKIKEMKGELLNEFYHKIDDHKNIANNIEKSFNEFKNEYATIRKKFLELAEFIKDIRFKKNLGVDIDKKVINNLYKNLIKKGKKSSKDKNVQLIDDISNIENMVFKVNNNSNDNNNEINSNEKILRRNKKYETDKNTNNIINIIKENYLDLNGNINKKKDNKENKRNINSNNNIGGIFKSKTISYSDNTLKDNETERKNDINPQNEDIKKINIYKENNNNDINDDKNERNYNSNIIYNDKIKLNNSENENNENKFISTKDELELNRENNIQKIKQNNITNEINNKSEMNIYEEKEKNEIKDKDKTINNNEIENKNKNEIKNKNENKNIEKNKDDIKLEIFKNTKIQISLENKTIKKEKKQIASATADTLSISDSFSSFCNNNTMGGNGTISDRNFSNISIPISYNINNVKCNKFILNDCQEENDNKIIKELASELEQSTAKKIKLMGSQKNSDEKKFQKNIIQNIEPINLINNINNQEIENKKNKLKSHSQKRLSIIKENIKKIEKNIFSEDKKIPKININKLLNNNKLKNIINQEIEIDNLNINSKNDIPKKNENELGIKSNNNSEYNNENNYNFYIENNPESINKKLLLFNQKLFDIETYMKEKFVEILSQIDFLKQLNNRNKFNNSINPYRTSTFRTDQNAFNTINNENYSSFIINGKDENLCYINYHTIKSPRFDVHSQIFPSSSVIKSLKKYNYFKDSILIDNLNKNKNDEISAIKRFIEKKINVNNSKTLYKDFSKKNLKSLINNKNENFINNINGDIENNDNIHSKIKNKSTITGNNMKWIDLKVLVNKKIPKNTSCQKLNPSLSGEKK